MRRKEKQNLLISQWGNPKDKFRNMDLIAAYFESGRASIPEFQINDRTWNDLDMDQIFEKIDRCESRIGQQKLFQLLRIQKNDKSKLASLEHLIDYYQKNSEERIKTQMILGKLDDFSFYSLHELFTGSSISNSKYHLGYKLLSMAAIGLIIVCVLIPSQIWLLTVLLLVNFSVHYIDKARIGSHVDSFINIHRIVRSIKKLERINSEHYNQHDLDKHVKNCKRITKLTNWISISNESNSDLSSLLYLIIELLKASFLLDTILFYNAVDKINDNKKSLQSLFNYLGTIDSCISIASFRYGEKKFCRPAFVSDSEDKLMINELRHPLLKNCVENDIELSNKSIIVTGSNMAGKTTFIKSIGINAILAQSINTSLSSQYIAPFYKIYSIINISDDISANKSYFMEEILALRNLIKESQGKQKCLFIFDELFKGTNTIDRMASSVAALSYLSKNGNTILLSTHDIEISSFLSDRFDLYFFKDELEDDRLTFNYRLNRGIPEKSNAIELLKLHSFPKEIINAAIEFKKNNKIILKTKDN